MKTRKQNQLLKETKDLINDMKDQSGSASYNMFLKLVKDIEEYIAKTNKEQVKQIKPKLPSFMTESSESPEVKEDLVRMKAKEEKKKQDDMEMLLDKKKRSSYAVLIFTRDSQC